MDSWKVNKQEQRREVWRQRVAQQETSGESIRAFCRGRGLKEHAFYGWRQRLRQQDTPVGFALVSAKPAAEAVPPIEVVLAGGARLLIPPDAAALRLVLGVLREPA